MSWILLIIFVVLGMFVVYRHSFFRLPGLNRYAPVALFSLKIVAGIAVWAVYTFYYPDRQYADIWKYYDDSEIIYEALEQHPADYFAMVTGIGIDDRIDSTYFHRMNHWHQKFENNLLNDSHTIIRFNALVRLISAGNYHTHALIMSFLAFIGLCALYKWIYPYLFQWKRVLAFILFISPSLLFWSSGVLKEGMLLLALGLLIYHSWKYREDRKMRRLVYVVLAVFLLAITKLYMLVFVLPALLTGFLLRNRSQFAGMKAATLILLLFLISLGLHYSVPRFSPYKIIASKQNDFLNLAKGGTYLVSDSRVSYLRPDQHNKLVAADSNGRFMIADGTDFYYWNIADNFADTIFVTNSTDTSQYAILTDNPVAGSLLEHEPLQPTPQSIVSRIPMALSHTILRPWMWELKPVMVIPSILENLLILALFLSMLLWYKKTSAKSILWFCLLFSFLALIVIGLTTPVLGAIVRYRTTALPFLLFAILLCTDKEKLLKRLPFLRRIL